MTARLLGLVLVMVAFNAVAQPVPPEASTRFDRAVKLFATGDYPSALSEFERVYELMPRPSVLYNIGLTWAAMNEPAKAVEALDQVLGSPGALDERRLTRAREIRTGQAAKLGALTITTSVPGAVVDIDNQTIGKVPFSGPVQVKAGKVLVTAVAPKYAPRRAEVVVPPGGTAQIALELLPLERAPAQLKVQSLTPAADVLVDGEKVGTTPLASTVALTPGEKKVAVVRDGYRIEQRPISLGEGSFGELTIELNEDEVATRDRGGELTVTSNQTQVVLTVDGRLRGKYEGPFKLPAGPHRVTFERGGFYPVSREVVIPSRGSTIVEVTFDPTAETLANVEATYQRQRILGWTGVGAGAAVFVGAGSYLAYNLAASAGIEREIATYSNGGICTNPTSGQQDDCVALAMNAQARLQEAQQLRLIGYLGMGVGALLALGGTFSLITAPDPHQYDHRVPDSDVAPLTSLDLSIGANQVMLTGRF